MRMQGKVLAIVTLLGLSLSAYAQAEELTTSASLLNQAQRSTAMQRYAGGRLQAIWNPQIKHNDVDWWLRSLRDWDSYGDGAVSGKSSSVALGMDMMTGKETRTGIYGMYNHTKLSGAGNGLQQDWRGGVYMGKQHGAVRQYVYANYGRLGTHYTRLGLDAKYHGQIAEIGAEYQYDLHAQDGKIYHVAPYVNMQASRYLQKGFSTNGISAGSLNNNYMAGEAGVELRRELSSSNFAARLGYKRVLTGAEPELNYSWRASGASFREQGAMDKDYLHLTLATTFKLKGNMSLTGEAGWLQGSHDRELMADVKLNWSL